MNMHLSWLTLCWICSELYLVKGSTPTVLPETIVPLHNGSSVCYGAVTNYGQLHPSCDTTEVIAIQSVRVGAKPIIRGCPKQVTILDGVLVDADNTTTRLNLSCCFPESSDCTFDYPYAQSGINYRYHTNCSGFSVCEHGIEVSNAVTNCTGDVYMQVTHYMYMDYACVEKNRIGVLCDDSTYQITGSDSFYLQSTGYPKHGIPSYMQRCSCTIRSNSSDINVYNLDVRLQDTLTGYCGGNLTISGTTNEMDYICNSATIFNITRGTFGSTVKLTFDNDQHHDVEKIWLGFKSDDGLLINCGVEYVDGYTTTSNSSSTTTQSFSTDTTASPNESVTRSTPVTTTVTQTNTTVSPNTSITKSTSVTYTVTQTGTTVSPNTSITRSTSVTSTEPQTDTTTGQTSVTGVNSIPTTVSSSDSHVSVSSTTPSFTTSNVNTSSSMTTVTSPPNNSYVSSSEHPTLTSASSINTSPSTPSIASPPNTNTSNSTTVSKVTTGTGKTSSTSTNTAKTLPPEPRVWPIILGAIGGLLLFILLIAVVGYCMWKYVSHKNNQNQEDENDQDKHIERGRESVVSLPPMSTKLPPIVRVSPTTNIPAMISEECDEKSERKQRKKEKKKKKKRERTDNELTTGKESATIRKPNDIDGTPDIHGHGTVAAAFYGGTGVETERNENENTSGKSKKKRKHHRKRTNDDSNIDNTTADKKPKRKRRRHRKIQPIHPDESY